MSGAQYVTNCGKIASNGLLSWRPRRGAMRFALCCFGMDSSRCVGIDSSSSRALNARFLRALSTSRRPGRPFPPPARRLPSAPPAAPAPPRARSRPPRRLTWLVRRRPPVSAGTMPVQYKDGEQLDLKVNKITSLKHVLSYGEAAARRRVPPRAAARPLARRSRSLARLGCSLACSPRRRFLSPPPQSTTACPSASPPTACRMPPRTWASTSWVT